MAYKYMAILAACLFMSTGLIGLDFYVDGSCPAGGNGTQTHPFKYISDAITLVHNEFDWEPNVINIRGRGTIGYTQNLEISGFNHPLTLQKWDFYPEEVLISGIYNSTIGYRPVITIYNNSAPIILKSLTIKRATNPTNGQLHGGGIAVSNSNQLSLDNCIVKNNVAYKGGGIYVDSTPLQINNSVFFGNTGIPYFGGLVNESYGGAIYGINSDISINNTLLHNNAGYTPNNNPTNANESIFMESGNLSCESTTIYSNDSTDNAVNGWGFNDFYQNSIIYHPLVDFNSTYNYCCIDNTTYTSIPGIGNIIADPLFTDYETFQLRWDADVKSPCIDAGNPDSNGNEVLWYDEPDNIDKDPNGSHIDIGAIYYNDESYRSKTIKLEKEEVWNWICIPAIDFPGNPRGVDHESYVFDTYHNNNLYINTDIGRILDQIMWWYNNELGSVWWDQSINGGDGAFIHPNPVHHVRAQYGYKVKLRDFENVPEIKHIDYSGFLPGGLGNNVPTLVIEPPVESNTCFFNDLTNTWERETWLGYFLEESLNPLYALSHIINNIVSIKTQEWSVDRRIENGNYTDYWEGYTTMEGTGAFNYGEAVAVRYIGTEEAVFQWGNPDTPHPELPRYERPEPSHFVFETKEDYLPVYATLDFSNLPPEGEPIEIAIYVDGECVGAEKIDGTEIQIKAYLETDDITAFNEELIEFELKYPDKSENKIISQFAVRNPITNLYELSNSIPKYCGKFMTVSLKSKDIANAQTPSSNRLVKNYPNPFNPETTIRFDLAKSGRAKLEIFNSKGQLVKTLVNEDKDAGCYNVKWNGKDNSGRLTSSGVYFYRLTAGGKSLTNKMLLLK